MSENPTPAIVVAESLDGYYVDYENHGKLTQRKPGTKVDKYIEMRVLLNLALDVEFFGLINNKPQYETRQAIIRALYNAVSRPDGKTKILVETE